MVRRARRKAAGGRDADAAPPEPSWRQRRLPRPRAKMRKAQAAVVAAGPATARAKWRPRLRLPAVRFRPALRHWLVLMFLAAAAFAGIQLFSNDRFFVFGAEISGYERVPRDAIYAASAVDGKNIFWVRPQELEERVRQVPGIAQATAHVRLPNQVTIRVYERLPLVQWEVKDRATWVADDGQPVPVVGSPPPLRLIDSTGSAAGPGANGNGLPQALMADLQAVHAARPELAEIYYGEQEGLYFRAPQGYTVYLGTQGDIAAKLGRLQVAQQQVARERTTPKVVDLRVAGTVYYR